MMTTALKIPRGFTLTASDHLGPKRYMKVTARRRWVIAWERAGHRLRRDATGWRLSLWTDRGWVDRSDLEASPLDAWNKRRK